MLLFVPVIHFLFSSLLYFSNFSFPNTKKKCHKIRFRCAFSLKRKEGGQIGKAFQFFFLHLRWFVSFFCLSKRGIPIIQLLSFKNIPIMKSELLEQRSKAINLYLKNIFVYDRCRINIHIYIYSYILLLSV